MLSQYLLTLACLALAHCDVSHILEEPTTEPPPPRPYAFAYTAGRYPGHADRHHAEVSDGSGVVKGTFSYVDPRQHVRRVDYTADKDGFHPVLSDVLPEHPADSEAVAEAKEKHYALYQKIAAEHAHPAAQSDASVNYPADSEAVAVAKARHYALYETIAASHANNPHPVEPSVPRQSASVAKATARHAELFRVIAEQHARIAAERDALQHEEEERQLLQEISAPDSFEYAKH